MDEKLINEYINNLVLQVNTVTQESIVLKTRLQVMEKEKNRLAETNKDLAEELDALKFQQQEEEKENKPEIENVIEEEPKVEKKIPKYVFIGDINFNEDGTVNEGGNSTVIPKSNVLKLKEIKL